MAEHEPDRIEVRGLELLVFCGVLSEEQARRQPFLFDLDIELDMTDAGRSDDLDHTVDYGALCGRLAEVLHDERFTLIERMATRIAELTLAEFPRVESITVVARKLRPPVPQHVDTTGVRIRRSR